MRVLSLCFILPCIALAGFARAEEVKEWTPETLSKKMQEIDEAFKAIEKRFRPPERRLGALENQVRQLRLKVDLMEIELRQLGETLGAIRRQLDTLAKRLETPPPAKGAQPPAKAAEKGKPVPADVATILSQKVLMGAESVTITGEVANRSKKPLVFAVVQADFVDKAGKVVKTASAYTEPRVIPAGSKGRFVLKTTRDPRATDHRLSLRTE